MLSGLFISQWSGRRDDKAVAKEVAQQHGTSESVGRYRKRLIADEAFAEIRKVTNEARKYHHYHTLSWDDDGYRVLPSKAYFEYTTAMRGLHQKFDAAADVVCEHGNYMSLIERAKRELNGLFRPEDYPASSAIRSKFDFRVVIRPFPASEDFRVSIGQQDEAQIREQIESDVMKAVAGSMQEVYMRLHGTITDMVQRLAAFGYDGEGKIVHPFRDTVLTNVTDLIGVLPKLNLLDDPALNQITGEIQQAFGKLNPQDLRDDMVVRQATISEAERISAKMQAYLGGVV